MQVRGLKAASTAAAQKLQNRQAQQRGILDALGPCLAALRNHAEPDAFLGGPRGGAARGRVHGPRRQARPRRVGAATRPRARRARKACGACTDTEAADYWYKLVTLPINTASLTART
jgi:hypothetical protein